MPISKALKAKFLLSWLFFIILAGSFLMYPAIPVYADATTQGLDTTAGQIPSLIKSGDYSSSFLASKIGDILGIVLSFIGVLFLGLMIYAGITWMIASGNEQTITKAKDMLINATIGLVIVLAAYALTSFVGSQLTK